ncbi:MAG: hypothetical protein U1E79_03500 [Ottowia sp.]
MYELQRIQGKYALVTMCIGGGQGIAGDAVERALQHFQGIAQVLRRRALIAPSSPNSSARVAQVGQPGVPPLPLIEIRPDSIT